MMMRRSHKKIRKCGPTCGKKSIVGFSCFLFCSPNVA
jgi:hypothetical protein